MKSQILTILALAVASVLVAAPPSAQHHVTGRLLAQPRLGVTPTAVRGALASAGARLEKTIGRINVHVLQVPEPALERVSAALMRTGAFTFVEPDHILHPSATPVAVDPNDPMLASQWHLRAIQSPYAWGVTQGSSNVVIAVVDSGAAGHILTSLPNSSPDGTSSTGPPTPRTAEGIPVMARRCPAPRQPQPTTARVSRASVGLPW